MTYKPSKRFSVEQLSFAFVRKFMPGRYRRTTNEKLMPANLVFSPIRPSVVERNPRYWVECDCGGLDEGCACGGSNGMAGRRLVSDYRV